MDWPPCKEVSPFINLTNWLHSLQICFPHQHMWLLFPAERLFSGNVFFFFQTLLPSEHLIDGPTSAHPDGLPLPECRRQSHLDAMFTSSGMLGGRAPLLARPLVRVMPQSDSGIERWYKKRMVRAFPPYRMKSVVRAHWRLVQRSGRRQKSHIYYVEIIIVAWVTSSLFSPTFLKAVVFLLRAVLIPAFYFPWRDWSSELSLSVGG